MIRFAFRVNANKDIGMGHLMRCLTLAEALGEKPLFFTNDNIAVLAKIHDFGSAIHVLPTHDDDFEVMVEAFARYPENGFCAVPSEGEELETFLPLLKKEKVDVLITDLICPSDEYLSALKNLGIFLVSIDELGKTVFPSHLVFNCNALSGEKRYTTQGKSKVYQGVQFVLLRSEFERAAKKQTSESVKKILISCGGTDMKGLSLKAARALQSLTGSFEIIFVVGPDFKFREELKAIFEGNHRMQVVHDVKEMPSLMVKADLAVASGGATMYELVCLGVPSVILDQYEHQNEFAGSLHKQGAVINLGLGQKVPEEAIREAVISLLQKDRREILSSAGKKQVDGKGAVRVANLIREALH
ncbi:MAG: UDP-2,4-diacetamido-2,4,6-trideoxy-beta-L-altropyranose hydrolase [Deltaproteobacteria bacterium]|nr:UDP-2,4-diacetamido-2,4,6-trideoxy-beta-L-altropyranose hydrolase [Deltaproteobacteria bacterium]